MLAVEAFTFIHCPCSRFSVLSMDACCTDGHVVNCRSCIRGYLANDT
jgi:hypothetical protein